MTDLLDRNMDSDPILAYERKSYEASTLMLMVVKFRFLASGSHLDK